MGNNVNCAQFHKDKDVFIELLYKVFVGNAYLKHFKMLSEKQKKKQLRDIILKEAIN